MVGTKPKLPPAPDASIIYALSSIGGGPRSYKWVSGSGIMDGSYVSMTMMDKLVLQHVEYSNQTKVLAYSKDFVDVFLIHLAKW